MSVSMLLVPFGLAISYNPVVANGASGVAPRTYAGPSPAHEWWMLAHVR